MSKDDAAGVLDTANVAAFPGSAFTPELIEEVNRKHALVLIGSKAVVMKENGRHAPVGERIQILSVDALNQWYRNRLYRQGEKWKTLGDLWMGDRNRRQFHGMEFAPSPDMSAGREGYYNLWQGFEVKPDPSGDCSMFIEHIEQQVCNGDVDRLNWVMSWFASIFQRPHERIGTSLVLRGSMGSGKSLPGEIIGSLIAPHYFLVDEPRYLTGQFNAHMATCLLLQADEAMWAGDKVAEGRLKGLVTSSHQMIEYKGIDPIQVRNHVRLMMTSNEDWVVPTGPKERRFGVFDVSDRHEQDRKYFGALVASMEAPGGREALLWELLNWKLDDAVLRTIPQTEALLDQKLKSAGSVEQWWYQCLDHGEVKAGSGWPVWLATRSMHKQYRVYCDQYNISRPVEERSFMKTLKRMCPGFVKRRLGKAEFHDVPEDIDGHRVPSATPANRPWGYEFPVLADARAWFDQAYGQPVDWNNDE